MDVESFEAGWLAKIITPEGGIQQVGAAVGILASTKEEIGAIAAGSGGGAPKAAAVVPSAPAAVATTPASAGFGIAVDMPALSSTMKEGKIVAWNKKIGDKGIPQHSLVHAHKLACVHTSACTYIRIQIHAYVHT